MNITHTNKMENTLQYFQFSRGAITSKVVKISIIMIEDWAVNNNDSFVHGMINQIHSIMLMKILERIWFNQIKSIANYTALLHQNGNEKKKKKNFLYIILCFHALIPTYQ